MRGGIGGGSAFCRRRLAVIGVGWVGEGTGCNSELTECTHRLHILQSMIEARGVMRETYLQASCRTAVRQPLYAQVREHLLARIRSGEWGAGETLPNEHVLSNDFDVSIGTVRRAVADLEANGVVVRKQGRGTFVAGRGSGALQERFCSVRGSEGQRLVIAHELLSLRRRGAGGREAEVLVEAEKGVVEIAQKVLAAGIVVGLEISAVPACLVPRIETQMLFGQDIYTVLADYGLLVTRVADTVGVEPAGVDAARELGCLPGSRLLVVTRRAFALDGRAVEVRVGHYLPEHIRYAAPSV